MLGTLLFILYINDFPLSVGLFSVILYADDTVIFSAASSIDQLQLNLSLDLNVVSNWLTANGLFLNLKKTEYIVFWTQQRLIRSESHSPLCMEGKEVNQVKSFKYLGVLLDECLSFNNHVNYVRSKVASRLGLLSQLQGCLTTEAANKIYFSLVLPILSFCDMCFCPLGSTNRKTLERLKWQATRIVYGSRPDIATELILENLPGRLLQELWKSTVHCQLTSAWLEKFLHTLKTISCYAARATTNIDVLDHQSLTLFFLAFILMSLKSLFTPAIWHFGVTVTFSQECHMALWKCVCINQS